MLWFALVFLVFLKIPLLYLCYVVWWAVKDPPAPGEGFGDVDQAGPDAGGPQPDSWWRERARRRPLRRGPHGSPTRRPAPTVARAKPPA